jgi:hypothetical protein
VRRLAARWRSRARRLAEEVQTRREEWGLERELERAIGGGGPILAGPWLSEVGYEILYWVPFLRWVVAAYRIPPERVIVVSRGGTASWYDGIASRYAEALDHIAAAELASRAAGGSLKQRGSSELDERVIAGAIRQLGLDRRPQVLHPSLMFRWFAPFWSGHETLGFVERHTRHARIAPPDVPVPPLPPKYAAVKFYAARTLPDAPATRAQLRALVDGLSDRFPVVQMDTGLELDEHRDYSLAERGRITTLTGRLDARTNLAVQTRVIAGAELFVGTCGSLAWLAPLLGVPTMPVFTDASFLHAHLHVARRVYGRVGAGRFAPVDLSGLLEAGLAVGGGRRTMSSLS